MPDTGHSGHHAISEYAQQNSAEPGREFKVEGQRRDINTIFLKLRIVDLTGTLCLIFSKLKSVSIHFFVLRSEINVVHGFRSYSQHSLPV